MFKLFVDGVRDDVVAALKQMNLKITMKGGF